MSKGQKIFQMLLIVENLKISRIFKNEANRLPSSARSLRPDCSTINLAETSDQPADWLLHPTGITFKFDAKLIRRYPYRKRKRPIRYPQ